jgi:hypothetical protein
MKKGIIVFIATIATLLFFQANSVFAVELNHGGVLSKPPVGSLRNERLSSESAPTRGLTPMLQKIKDFKGATPSAANKVDNLKQRADKEIQRRVEDLSRLITKINGLKKITDSQKADFVSQIQAEITNLNTLKAKIDADTDLDTLRTDVQSIVKSYRIYLLFIPKINVLVAADSLDTIADKLDVVAAKLDLRIGSSSADTTSLKTTLADMKTKTADIRVQSQKARGAVLPLTPDGFPGNKTILQQGRQYIVAGKKDADGAKKDAMLIMQGLRELNHETKPTESTTTTTVAPTASPTPTI